MNMPLAAAGAAKNYLVARIIKSHNHLGYNATQWFEWMLDDCLAGFGKRLAQPWEAKTNERLFELGGLYANAVIENPWIDVLGGVYQELASNYGRKALGQFFTPAAVTACMAQMSFDVNDVKDKTVFRICEPCVGAGGMLLSILQTIRQEAPELLGKISVTGIDVDSVCVKMAALQLIANNYIHQGDLGEIVIHHGNSLGDPKHLVTFYHASTPHFDFLAADEERTKAAMPVVVEEKIEEPAIIKPKRQLSIFDFQIA